MPTFALKDRNERTYGSSKMHFAPIETSIVELNINRKYLGCQPVVKFLPLSDQLYEAVIDLLRDGDLQLVLQNN